MTGQNNTQDAAAHAQAPTQPDNSAQSGPKSGAASLFSQNAGVEQITLTSHAASDVCLPAVPKADRRWVAPSAVRRRQIVEHAKSIAIVGASTNPARASYFVSTYLLQSTDYDVYFVNPREHEILGRPCYPNLEALPVVPDIVDVFRKPCAIKPIANEAAAIGSPVLWIQLGIWDDDVAEYAESLGLEVVMDRCIKIEHARFHRGLHLFGFNTGFITSQRIG